MVPFQEIAAAFEEETKIKVEATYSSTGNLYGQIYQRGALRRVPVGR